MRLLRRLAYWLRFSSHHTELMDELQFHREMTERELVGGGLSPAAAQAETRRRMGNETLMREEARAVWLRPWLEAMWQDARYALRELRRSPSFTAGVVLTLALGIGANAAMFSLVDRLLFRAPALMVDPATVNRVYLYRTTDRGESQTGGNYARYMDIGAWSTAFSRTAGAALRTLTVGAGDNAETRDIAVVSAGFFEFFEAPPVLGRYFTSEEDAPPAPAPVAVLSHGLWKTRFQSRRDVLGAALQIDAVTYTIIGVAPDRFVGLWPFQPPAAFIPVTTYAASRGVRDWATTYGTAFGLEIIVRRKPGVTLAVASTDLSRALRRSYQTQIGSATDAEQRMSSLRPRAVAASVLTDRGPDQSSMSSTTKWLGGVTIIVLLIACGNVANLLLARTIARRREIAVRIALGISRSRLFGQLLTEGVLLALLGGGVSLVVALWGSRLLQAMYLPGSEAVSLLTDPRTLCFTGAVALGVGVLIGLAPMVQVARGAGPTAALKSAARAGTYQRSRLRIGLVVLQCALSLVLLSGAALFLRSLRNVRDVRLGFDPEPVLIASLALRDVQLDSAARIALRLRLLESVRAVPGVSHATLQEAVPFAGMSSYPIFVSGLDSVKALGLFKVNTISADYFRVMDTRLLRGRAIENGDIAGGLRVAVVSESMANVLWRGRDPIGQCFRIAADTMPCTYVVGVAEDIHSESAYDDEKPFYYYLPAAQWHPEEGGLFVLVRGNVRLLAESVRKHLQREMPGSSVITVMPLADIVNAKFRPWIVGARLLTAFAALGLVLAAVGLYSVIAYAVAQRRHEVGVRLALGASAARIVRLIILEGLGLALIGIAIGGTIALAVGRWIGPLLFEQSPYDLSVFALVSFFLLGVAALAGCVPAVRAARVDPTTALRAD